MGQTATVDVVVPVYNEKRALPDCTSVNVGEESPWLSVQLTIPLFGDKHGSGDRTGLILTKVLDLTQIRYLLFTALVNS